MTEKYQKINKVKNPSILETILENKHMDFSDLADFLGINRSSVSKWIKGSTQPRLTVSQWQKLSSLFSSQGYSLESLPEDFYLSNRPSSCSQE